MFVQPSQDGATGTVADHVERRVDELDGNSTIGTVAVERSGEARGLAEPCAEGKGVSWEEMMHCAQA